MANGCLLKESIATLSGRTGAVRPQLLLHGPSEAGPSLKSLVLEQSVGLMTVSSVQSYDEAEIYEVERTSGMKALGSSSVIGCQMICC